MRLPRVSGTCEGELGTQTELDQLPSASVGENPEDKRKKDAGKLLGLKIKR